MLGSAIAWTLDMSRSRFGGWMALALALYAGKRRRRHRVLDGLAIVQDDATLRVGGETVYLYACTSRNTSVPARASSARRVAPPRRCWFWTTWSTASCAARSCARAEMRSRRVHPSGSRAVRPARGYRGNDDQPRLGTGGGGRAAAVSSVGIPGPVARDRALGPNIVRVR